MFFFYQSFGLLLILLGSELTCKIILIFSGIIFKSLWQILILYAVLIIVIFMFNISVSALQYNLFMRKETFESAYIGLA